MSKPNLIGIISVAVVIAATFMPWISIESKHLVFTGLQTTGSSFGEPGKANIFFAVISGLLFLVQRKWSARGNLFAAAFLAAWTFRNLMLFSRCEMGECPDRHIGLFLCLIFSIVAFICVLFTMGERKALPVEDELKNDSTR